MPLIVMKTNHKEFKRALQRASNSLNSEVLGRKLRVAWSKELYKINKTHFSTRGHGSWPPLTPKYKKRRQAEGSGVGILRRNDDLYASVTRMAGANQTIIRRRGTGYDYIFRTTERKADWHHKGRGRLPVRTVIEPTQRQENRLQRIGGKIIGKHIVRAMRPFARIKGNAFKVISPMPGKGTEN